MNKSWTIKRFNFLSQYKNLVILILIILTLTILELKFSIREQISTELIQSFFQQNMILSTLLFTLFFVIANIYFIPGWVFLGAAVLTLGKLHGFFLAFFAANVSAFVGYQFVHFIRPRHFDLSKKPLLKKVMQKFEHQPILCTFITRSLCQTYPMASYALSLTNISLKNYMIGTFLGLIFPLTIYTFLAQIILGSA